MKDRTQWYPPEIKPVRVGWYERYYEAIDCFPGEVYLDWWSGTMWFMDCYKGKPGNPSKSPRIWRGRNYPTVDDRLRELVGDILDGALS